MSVVGMDLSTIFGTGGIQTYAWELLAHMVPLEQRPDLYLLTRSNRIEQVRAVTGTTPSVTIHGGMPHPLALGTALRGLTQAYKGLLWRKHRSSVDLVHFHEVSIYQPTAGRHVTTVHDLFPLQEEVPVPPVMRKQWVGMAMEVLQSAERILVPSSYTKSVIRQVLPEVEERVRVTPLAASDRFLPSDQGRPIAEPYLVWIGRLDPRKNLRRILQSWQSVSAAARGGAKLVLIGHWHQQEVDAFDPEVARLLAAEGVEIRNRISEEEHRQLLTHAHGLVFPSIAEGFGLPAVEAMKCGCPVLSSNTTSLPEVVGRCSDPGRPDEGTGDHRGDGTTLDRWTSPSRTTCKGASTGQAVHVGENGSTNGRCVPRGPVVTVIDPRIGRLKRVEIAIRNVLTRMFTGSGTPTLIDNPSAAITLPTTAKVLFLRQDRIGDVLITTPIVRAVRERFPEAQVDILLSTNNVVVRNTVEGLVNNVLVYQKSLSSLWQIIRQIRATRYDLVVDLLDNASTTSTLFVRASGAPYRLGIDKENRGVYSHVVPLLDRTQVHVSDRIAQLMMPFGIEPKTVDMRPRYPVSLEEQQKAIHDLALDSESNAVGVILSGSLATRRYGPENTIQVIKAIQERYPDGHLSHLRHACRTGRRPNGSRCYRCSCRPFLFRISRICHASECHEGAVDTRYGRHAPGGCLADPRLRDVYPRRRSTVPLVPLSDTL